MSTDYGLRCKQCNSDVVPDNMRMYGIDIIKRDILALIELGKVYPKLDGGDVEIHAYWCDYGFKDFLTWLVTHENHALVVVDEYGHEHGPLQAPSNGENNV